MYPNRSRILALVLALVAALAAATPAEAQDPAPTPTLVVAPIPTPGPVPEGVDVADYGRAFAYWQVEGLDPVKCPQGPVAVYDDVTNRKYGYLAYTLSNDPCHWWFGDDYRALDAVHRCHVVTHELGHLLGRPDGLGAAGDPLGVMGQFAITPRCAEVQSPEERAARAYAEQTIGLPDPMADAALAGRADEVAAMAALSARWDRYDRKAERRERLVERRDRCLRAAAKAKTPRGRRRAAARCRARVTIPRMPAKPSLSRPY